jgi:acetyl esterase/lipase
MHLDLSARVDDEHRAALEQFPPNLLDLGDLALARTTFDAFVAGLPVPPPPDGLTVRDVPVPSIDGADVLVRIYTPAQAPHPAPGLLNIHGGGMVLGSVGIDDAKCMSLAENLGAVVASVEYRLAPEHPYPAPLEDCYAALAWFSASADELGVNRDRIAVIGASAGGGLAAGTALAARDRGGPPLCFQLLVYPMLDDRHDVPGRRVITDPRVWSTTANLAAWRAYLGELRGDDVPGYAAPARATDLSGLPPTYLCVGDLDLFADETLVYARRLLAGGVPVELHLYPGAFHGSSSFVPSAPVSRRWAADTMAALHRALHATT